MKISKVCFLLIFSGSAIALETSAGTSVGGGIGAKTQLEMTQQEMMMLQSGALNGDLIRVSQIGEDDAFLEPKEVNSDLPKITARVLPTGEEVAFVTKNPIKDSQNQLALSLARSIKSLMPGVLPITNEDLAITNRPKVETIPISALDQQTVEKLKTPAAPK